MHWLTVSFLLICIYSCSQEKKKQLLHPAIRLENTHSYLSVDTSYADTKKKLVSKKARLNLLYSQARQSAKAGIENQIKDCWIAGISTDLYKYWTGTPWDYNGTTRVPQEGTIACGYFVATLLLDMGLEINRTKLSVCAASQMMQQLTPHQKINKLNSLPYNQFCDSLQHLGKGVYIIGLDFHVGFIINDGFNCWFIHSNYINRQGVTKELVQLSLALRSSNTRWLIDLTSDKDFIHRWLTAQPV